MENRKYRIAGEEYNYDGMQRDDNKLSRTSFAFIGEDEELVVREPGDSTPMVLKLDMEDKSDDFEATVRGVFDASNIIFFIGEYYMQVPDIEMFEGLIPLLRPYINNRYGYFNTDIAIWNGVQIGRVGDIWPPVKLVGVMHSDDSFTWFKSTRHTVSLL